MDQKKPKLIVIGIDGGSWNLVNEFIKDLPNFNKIKNKGIALDLNSTIPPVTCPAWKSYSTGKDQDELEKYWWGHINFEKSSFKFFSSIDFHQKEIWDILQKFGYRSIVINLPLTYPPKKIDGMMIAGFPASDADSYTYPEDLKIELLKHFDYRIHPKHHIELFKEKTLDEIYSIIQTRFNVLYHYIEKESFDFAHITIFYTDDIQHYLWNDKEAIYKAYKIIDENIGKIISRYPNTNIMIMSDHGFQPTKDSFLINNYFREKDWLIPIEKTSNKMSEFSSKLLNNEVILRTINYIFMSLPRDKQIKLKKMFLPGEDEFSIEKTINLKKSLIIGAKQGPIFINLNQLKEKNIDYDSFIKELKRELKNIKSPNGEYLIKDLYEVPSGNDSPQFILIPNNGFEIEIKLTEKDYLWKSEYSNQKGWIAHHYPIGIFFAYGKSISNIKFNDSIKISDIAHKIYQLYDLPNDFLNNNKKLIPSKKQLKKIISNLHRKKS